MKKIISVILFLLIVNLMMGNDIAYAMDGKHIKAASEENYEIFEKNTLKTLEIDDDSVEMYIVDPGAGAVRIVRTNNWSSGSVYEDGQKSGIFSSIADLGVTIINSFSGKSVFVKVSTMVYDVASNVFGITSSYVERSKPVTTKLYHSFSYWQKLGQAYYPSTGWKTKIRIETRLWMKHEFSSFATTSGYTRTGTYDSPNPIMQDYYNSNFTNDSWILDQAQGRYHGNLGEWNLTWTY